MKLKELQEKYGKPTLEQTISAFYTLKELQEKADKIQYMHNFQLERFDIVEYIYKTHDVIKELKTLDWLRGNKNDT